MHRISEIRRVAPGIGGSIIPNSDIWNIKGLSQEEIMIKAMEWKTSLKNSSKLPKHRLAHKFHLNKLKVA